MEWDFKTVGLTLFIMLTIFLLQRSAMVVMASASEKIHASISNNENKLLPYVNPIKRDIRHFKSKVESPSKN